MPFGGLPAGEPPHERDERVTLIDTSFAPSLLISAVALLVLGALVWLGPDDERGARWLAATALLGAVRSAALASWIVGGAAPGAAVALRLAAAAAAVLPWTLLAFALHATRLLPRAQRGALWVSAVPSLAVAALALGPVGGLSLWSALQVERSGGAAVTVAVPGPYGVAGVAIEVVLVAAAIVLVAVATVTDRGRRSRRSWLLAGLALPAVGAAVAWLVAEAAPASLPFKAARLPWATLLMAPASLAVGYGVVGRSRPRPDHEEQEGQPRPAAPSIVGRGGLADDLPQAVVLIDETDRVAYANAAAAALLPRSAALPVASADALFRDVPALLAALQARRSLAQEIELPQGAGSRALEAWLTPLREASGRYAGTLVTLVDIGRRRRAEAAAEVVGAAADRRSAVLEALQEGLRAIGRGESLGLVLDIVLTSAARAVEVPHGALYVHDAGADVLRRKTAVGGFEAREALALRRDEGASGEAWATASVVTVDELPAPEAGPGGPGWAGCAVAVPLRLGGRGLGVLLLARARSNRRPFDADEVDTLRRFAELAAIALRDAGGRQRALRAEAELEWLDRLDAAIARGASDTVVLDLALRAARAAAGFERAVVWLPTGEGRALEAVAWTGLTPGAESSQGVALDGSAPLLEDAFFGGHEIVLQGGGPLPDKLRPRGPAAASPLMRAAWPVVLPLRGSGLVVGVLVADDQDRGAELEPRLRALRRIAARAGQALERASLRQDAQCRADEAKRVRAQLQAAVAAREELLAALPVAYFETDLRGDLTRASAELAALTGRTESSLLGVNLAELAVAGSEGVPADLFGRVLRTGGLARRASWPVAGGPGRAVRAELTIGILRGPTSEAVGYFGVVAPRRR